jgi:hypothetical protein
MLKLIRIHDDQYVCLFNNDWGALRSITGNRLKTFALLHCMGMADSEIEEALVQLQLNRHRMALFGIGGGFLYTLADSDMEKVA